MKLSMVVAALAALASGVVAQQPGAKPARPLRQAVSKQAAVSAGEATAGIRVQLKHVHEGCEGLKAGDRCADPAHWRCSFAKVDYTITDADLTKLKDILVRAGRPQKRDKKVEASPSDAPVRLTVDRAAAWAIAAKLVRTCADAKLWKLSFDVRRDGKPAVLELPLPVDPVPAAATPADEVEVSITATGAAKAEYGVTPAPAEKPRGPKTPWRKALEAVVQGAKQKGATVTPVVAAEGAADFQDVIDAVDAFLAAGVTGIRFRTAK